MKIISQRKKKEKILKVLQCMHLFLYVKQFLPSFAEICTFSTVVLTWIRLVMSAGNETINSAEWKPPASWQRVNDDDDDGSEEGFDESEWVSVVWRSLKSIFIRAAVLQVFLSCLFFWRSTQTKMTGTSKPMMIHE